MKILFVTNFLPASQAGGTEVYSASLAKAISQMGHSSHILCADEWGSGDSWRPRHRDTVYDGIPVRGLSWNWQVAPDPFVSLYNNPAIERHVQDYLRDLAPDIVHVTSCYSLGAGVIHAARQVGVPVVLTLTDFWFISPRQTLARPDGSLCMGPESELTCATCLGGDSNMYRTLTKVLPAPVLGRGLARVSHMPAIARRPGFRGYVGDVQKRAAFLRETFDQVDAAIAPSKALRDIFVHNGYPASRLRLSSYGLDTSWVQQMHDRRSDRQFTIGYIGQVEPIKGVDILVKAFLSLGDVPTELKIFGGMKKNPAFADRLRGLARDNQRIQFMGEFDRSQVADVFSQIDVAVVPSVWFENRPLVITEGFAAGKPVICSDLSGMTELVHDEVNGLVFGAGDVAGLTTAMRRMISDPGLVGRLRRNIPPVRTVEQELDALVQVYQEQLSAVRGRNLISTAP